MTIPPLSLVPRLGERMALSKRRVVRWLGETAHYETPIGVINGMADGVILVRKSLSDEAGQELTVAEAKKIAEALTRSAYAVEQWQEHASGFNRVRVFDRAGQVFVHWRGRERPMRRSVLRGSRHAGFWRRCTACKATPKAIWVAADDLREHGTTVHHAEVCDACIEKLRNAAPEVGR